VAAGAEAPEGPGVLVVDRRLDDAPAEVCTLGGGRRLREAAGSKLLGVEEGAPTEGDHLAAKQLGQEEPLAAGQGLPHQQVAEVTVDRREA
jgi:hypothetical protein